MNLLTPKVGGSYILEQTVMTMILSLVKKNIPRKGENLFAGVSFGGNIAWVLYRRSVQEAHAFASAIGALDDAGQVPSVTQSMAEDMGVLVKIGSLLLLPQVPPMSPKLNPKGLLMSMKIGLKVGRKSVVLMGPRSLP